MAFNPIKVCGVVAAIHPLESRENGDRVYYSQAISIAVRTGSNDAYINVTINGAERIQEMAQLITESYNSQSIVTASLDLTSRRASKWCNIACWKLEQGDTTAVAKPAPAVPDGAPFFGITPTVAEAPAPEGYPSPY